MSALGAHLLLAELNATEGLTNSARMVGRTIGLRIRDYPNSARGGRESVARAIHQRTGIQLHETTVWKAIQLLRRHHFIAVSCCAGDACVGGRHHAATYVVGTREFGNRWVRQGRFFVRKRAAPMSQHLGDLSISSTPESKEEPSARPRRSRGVENPPQPRPPTTARSGPQHIAALLDGVARQRSSDGATR